VEKLFEIGEIVKIHGCRGGVRVRSYLTEPQNLLPNLEAVHLQGKEPGLRRYPLRRQRLGNKCFFLEMEGVNNPQDAEVLVGCRVLAAADKLAALPEGEYYWHELVGMEAVTEEGCSLGRIREIFSTGSNDVYVCDNGKEERLLPAIGDVIRKVDRAAGIMTVRLLEGL